MTSKVKSARLKQAVCSVKMFVRSCARAGVLSPYWVQALVSRSRLIGQKRWCIAGYKFAQTQPESFKANMENNRIRNGFGCCLINCNAQPNGLRLFSSGRESGKLNVSNDIGCNLNCYIFSDISYTELKAEAHFSNFPAKTELSG